ncbi:Starch-binding associating with outer membrane [Pustulibacterium marinum]|uniref:Starch-binding associating with outer membrane n=1 Tax=Pustulibacterium marinum TaxID=1224947 RepID=A0A1I7HIF3_9FLAO|nr:RagB/SusD family nutrient uptake outer membrane protein [Pustulibacterium marinum]SFU60554.1 Starch-binding associating with outer membrane [Pustulibacterium marinum]
MVFKNIKLVACTIALATVSVSCVLEEDLNQVNPNFETEASFWQNDEDALLGINAAYSSLLTDGTYMRSTPLLLDLKSDDARSYSPWDAMYNVGRFNSSVSNAAIYGWAFETYYQGVYRCNQVLANVPNIEFEDTALKDRILGQAYFLRGLYFFHLVNMFKNVPLPLDTENLYYPQSTQEEGWAQVMSDMQMAVDLLPWSYDGISGADGNSKGRATKGAAYGYLGKAYLFTYDYQSAKTAFEQVINSGEYALVANYADNFTEANENNSESIFEVQFDREVGGVALGWGGAPLASWGKTSARAITYAPRGFGWTDVQPTWTLFNEFQEELTVDGEVDPRLDATIAYNKDGGMTIYGQDFATFYAGSPSDLNDLFCKKYQNTETMVNEFDWRSGINERLMRYADVLLMYAECLNELGQTSDVYTYIQMVRDRVNLPDLSTTMPGMSQAEMREQIGHERYLEFALEGHRFDDIRRWGWLQDSAKLAWLADRDDELQSYVAGREFFPIPQLEVDSNPNNIEQNPGY